MSSPRFQYALNVEAHVLSGRCFRAVRLFLILLEVHRPSTRTRGQKSWVVMYRRGSARLYQLVQTQICEAASQTCSQSAAAAGVARGAAAQTLWQSQLQSGCHAWFQQLGSRSLRTWGSKAPLGLGQGMGRQQQRVSTTTAVHTACMLGVSIVCGHLRERVFRAGFDSSRCLFVAACSPRRSIQTRHVWGVATTK